MSLTSRGGERCEQGYRAGSFTAFKVCVLALRIEAEQRALRIYPAPTLICCVSLDRALPILNLFPHGSTKQSDYSSSAYLLISCL